METRHRRWAPFANGWATSERGGHRVRRAEPNAGAGTPGVRPHHITRNTGWAQCAHTPDPCNKAHRRVKTDRIDGETLIRTLMAYKRGEPRVCSMVRVPTP